MHVEKMHVCGNDFCLVLNDSIYDYSKLSRKICNRNTGIGADGLIVVKNDPLEMILYNPDGSRNILSANAMLCFIKYCKEHELIQKNKFSFYVASEKKSAEILSSYPFSAKINIGEANYYNSMLYISDCIDSFGRLIKVKDRRPTIYSLSLGSVHTIIFVEDLNSSILTYADDISRHEIFNRGSNVSFVRIINKNSFKIKSYMLNIGWVKCSGLACCAAALAANKLKLIGNKAVIEFEDGSLDVSIEKNKISIIGTVSKVFECEYEGV